MHCIHLAFLMFLFAGSNDNVDVHTSNKWRPFIRCTIPVLAGHESLWNNEVQNTGAHCRGRCMCICANMCTELAYN